MNINSSRKHIRPYQSKIKLVNNIKINISVNESPPPILLHLTLIMVILNTIMNSKLPRIYDFGYKRQPSEFKSHERIEL